MSRKPKKPKNPEPETPVQVLLGAMRRLLLEDEDRPVMVATWAVVCEYIDEDGAAGLAAWSSDDPHWRVNGLLSGAIEMLSLEYDDEEIDGE